jgi:glycosyltransferase involved in cell wall biosynthesis
MIILGIPSDRLKTTFKQMKEYPLVTVYITNYNYGRFIRQAIESVLCQTYSFIELLIIDDGSGDNSREVIETYADHEKVKVIYQKNRGLNASNNVALNMASGKYFIRLDADDYFEPYAIALMVSLMEGKPEIGLLFPDYYYVDEIGNIIGVESRHDFDREVSLYDLPSHGACTMVRTEELRKLGGYNEAFSCQDGYELWLKYVLNSKVSNINKPLFYYRQHKMSLTQDEGRILETRKKIKKYCLEKYGIARPKTVAIVPIKPNTVDGVLWALLPRDGQNELFWAIKKLVDSACFEEIIITSSNTEILNELNSLKKSLNLAGSAVQILGFQRNALYELANHSLDMTIKEIIDQFELESRFEAIGLLGIETPFIKSSTIEEAVNTLALYNATSVICVRQDHSSYFTHNGEGMHLIFEKSRYNNYERKVLYKRVSGFSITLLKNYLINYSFLTPRMGHVIVSPEESLGIQYAMDWKLFKVIKNTLAYSD